MGLSVTTSARADFFGTAEASVLPHHLYALYQKKQLG